MIPRPVLKALAWVTIVGGTIAHPIIYGLMIAHHIDPRHAQYEAYMVPMDSYLMIFGMIGSVTGGAILLILLDLQQRSKGDGDIVNRF